MIKNALLGAKIKDNYETDTDHTIFQNLMHVFRQLTTKEKVTTLNLNTKCSTTM